MFCRRRFDVYPLSITSHNCALYSQCLACRFLPFLNTQIAFNCCSFVRPPNILSHLISRALNIWLATGHWPCSHREREIYSSGELTATLTPLHEFVEIAFNCPSFVGRWMDVCSCIIVYALIFASLNGWAGGWVDFKHRSWSPNTSPSLSPPPTLLIRATAYIQKRTVTVLMREYCNSKCKYSNKRLTMKQMLTLCWGNVGHILRFHAWNGNSSEL